MGFSWMPLLGTGPGNSVYLRGSRSVVFELFVGRAVTGLVVDGVNLVVLAAKGKRDITAALPVGTVEEL